MEPPPNYQSVSHQSTDSGVKRLPLHHSPVRTAFPGAESSVLFNNTHWHHMQQDDLVGLWWWSVGCVRPSSPSFAFLIFFLARHFWPKKERCLWPSISSLCSSQWKLTAQLSEILPLNHAAAELYLFPGHLRVVFRPPCCHSSEESQRGTTNLQLAALNSFSHDWMHLSIKCKVSLAHHTPFVFQCLTIKYLQVFKSTEWQQSPNVCTCA